MTIKARVAVQTLGCKLNQAESESIAHELSANGYIVVLPQDDPQIFILNTCTVTGVADRKCRNLIRRARSASDETLILATGCYSKRAESEVKSIVPGVITHCGDQRSLVELLDRVWRPAALTVLPEHAAVRRKRSFVKVQDGCTYGCSYCVVPSVRGPEVSRDMNAVIEEIGGKVADGYKEVVLTGTNVGSYLSKGLKLGGLVRRVLKDTGVQRLRISSLQPRDMSADLIDCFGDTRVCRHVHMPLQSGSEPVLRRMGRNYSLEEYEDAFRAIMTIPDVSITTDVIVGFPGETEVEHEQSLATCANLKFSAIHVFPYSTRQGTAAARMKQVASTEKRKRTSGFLMLAKKSREEFQSRFVGRVMEVLWENREDSPADSWSGLTGNYIRVNASATGDLTNKIIPVKLERVCGGYAVGVFQSSQASKRDRLSPV